ncbi:uncharacterized protein LOC135122681 [Zophobas morio]|uniref:uncharacterized protein LOC135122681 n=1 Tax=Zophobas morio TaxID=2755281 RepID=UPI003082E086
MRAHATTITLFFLIFDESTVLSVHSQIPSGGQFLVFGNDGGYRYGYYTSEGLRSEPSKQVRGHHVYKNNLNTENQDDIHLYPYSKHPFLPLLYETTIENRTAGGTSYTTTVSSKKQNELSSKSDVQKIDEKIDDVKTTSRTSVNVNSKDLIKSKNSAGASYISEPSNSGNNAVNVLNPDGSFFFAYTSGASSRAESADVENNVQGKYSYTDDSGTHDLTYVARKDSGFLVTGGSLAIPNGLRSIHSSAPESPTLYSVPFESPPHNDSSYSFEYATPLQSRQEIGDNKGNVYGRYSFVNEEGSHDLRYVAGSSTGFLPVGGSLVKTAGFRQSEEEHADKNSYEDAVTSNSQFSLANSNYKSDNFVDIKKQNLFSGKKYGAAAISNDESINRESGNSNDNAQKIFLSKYPLGSEHVNIDTKSTTEESSVFNKNQVVSKNSPSIRGPNMEATVKNYDFPIVSHIIVPSVVVHSYNNDNRQFGYIYSTLQI